MGLKTNLTLSLLPIERLKMGAFCLGISQCSDECWGMSDGY
jgi:hypothetical protein